MDLFHYISMFLSDYCGADVVNVTREHTAILRSQSYTNYYYPYNLDCLWHVNVIGPDGEIYDGEGFVIMKFVSRFGIRKLDFLTVSYPYNSSYDMAVMNVSEVSNENIFESVTIF